MDCAGRAVANSSFGTTQAVPAGRLLPPRYFGRDKSTRRANQSAPRKPVQPRLQKYFALAVGQISGFSPRVSPTEGRIASRHERAVRCGGRGSVGAQICLQGGFRERATACRTNDVAAYGKTVWFWHPLLVSSCRWRHRSDRIGVTIKPTATVTTRIRRRGERGISRKAIARGMPECFR
jgi:hypothetical protein